MEKTVKTNETTGVIAWFAKNPVAANLLMLFFMLAGIVTAFQIRKETLPESRPGIILIQVAYPGASPADVVEGVVKKIEDALQGVEGIKETEATAHEGFADIAVKAETGTNINALLDRVKSRLDSIASFPGEAERPVVSELVIKTQVLWLILSGELDDGNMKTLARQVRDDLLAEKGISQVDIIGTRPFEISINVSEDSLKKYSLTFDDIVSAVASGSVDLPGGSIKTKGEHILLRSEGKAKTGRDFAELAIVAKTDGTIVRVKDVAEVTDGFTEDDWFLRYNEKNAVGLQVFRTGDESTLSVAEAVRNFVEKNKTLLPQGASAVIIADTSVHLKDRLNLMMKNMAMGSVLVFISLALFLRMRIAFFVMLGLPVSFLGAVWIMPLPFIGASINMVTLYGFILVLGIVVDDAIVIGESIHETIQREGAGTGSVIKGVRAVATPATFGVLTTVAAFIPTITIPGADGKMWASIGYVVIACLVFSLIESKLILPAHLGSLAVQDNGRRKTFFEKIQTAVSNGLALFLDKVYSPLLKICLNYRYATIAAFFGIFILTMACVTTGIVRFVFLPQIESDMIQAELEITGGTSREVLFTAVREIEKAAARVNKKFTAGGEREAPIKNFISYAEADRKAGFFVEMSSGDTRKVSASAVVNEWRKETRHVLDIPGVKSLQYTRTLNESQGPPINFELSGRTIDNLAPAAEELKKALAGYDGVFDIRDTSSDGKPEIKLSMKPEAESVGISLLHVARQVRQAFYGEKVQKIQRGPEEVDVFVRYPENERKNIADLESMWIRTNKGKAVPITSVANVEIGRSPAEIVRTDRKMVISVLADVDKNIATPAAIIREISENLFTDLQDRYKGISVRIAGESEEENEIMKSLKKWGVLALFAIFAMMAVPLQSYIKPFIIMTAIPFGIVGAVLGHLFMGIPISILSLCGIIALSGVVVNDSLVLVDYITRRTEAGDAVEDAVSSAGVRRFRAIMLTSLTTFFGLLPMLMEKSLQAQFLIPMAVSLAYGILFSTVISLFLIPALYLSWNDIRELWKRRSISGG